jgi:hypothetical protein
MFSHVLCRNVFIGIILKAKTNSHMAAILLLSLYKYIIVTGVTDSPRFIFFLRILKYGVSFVSSQHVHCCY